MDQGLSIGVPGPSLLLTEWNMDYWNGLGIINHISDLYFWPSIWPRSIIIAQRMDLWLLKWPRDYQSVSQVHIFDNQHVPGPVITCPRSIAWGPLITVPGLNSLSLLCPMGSNWMSLVHHYCLKNGPGTIKLCPWSIFLIINVPGPVMYCPRSIIIT
jgi:hypothetical protein